MSRWPGWVLVGSSMACSSQYAAGPSPTAVAAQPPPAATSTAPVYRFMPASRLGRGMQQLDAEHVAGLEPGGDARIVLGRDGSMERVVTPADERLMGGVAVPEHLGRGFLFWTTSGLYRAQTFTGKLEPIAPVSTNAIGVEFGPSSVLLFAPGRPPRAYALEPARRVPVSPHGALEIAAADAERAVAFDAAGRALATVDGGRSWKDVTATLGEPAQGLKQEAHEVGFVLGRELVAWLEKDGGFVRRPPATTKGKPPQEEAFDALKHAVLGGVPLSATHALAVAEGLWDVELASGRARALTKKVPYGSSCQPLSAAENALLICFDYGMPHSTLAVVSGALSEQPEVEKVFQRPPPYDAPAFALGDHVLVVGKSCSGTPVDGVACVRTLAKQAAWTEVNIQAALGTTWEVLYWVPKAKGGVAALVWEKNATGNTRRLALIDAASGMVTPFDAPFERVAPRGFARTPERSFVVLENGTLRGFTGNSGLSVDARGQVSTPTRTFNDVHGAGAFALAQDDAGRLWQTQDYGEHWVEVARPPFESEKPPGPAGSRREGPRAITCSLVGCTLAHESGLGTWLRVGWPVEPPRANAPSPASGESVPLAPPIPEPRPLRPKLRCVAGSAPVPPAPPLLTRGTAPTATNILFNDVFSQDTLLGHGLRGFVRVGQTGKAKLEPSLEILAATKAPFTVDVVLPLEPAPRILRASGSLAAWAHLLEDRAPELRGDPLTVSFFRGSARPVLSAVPGRADGVLFVDEDLAFAVTRSGKLHPIRPGCRADSGYVDAQGTLFVSCAVDSGATAVGDADHHRKLFRLPPAERFRYDSGEGMSFFEPGRQLLTDPDAVAVGPDGKLAILRSAGGSEPSSAETPAWLLSADGPPVELAPWASLEPATSSACAKGGGYRALIQTGTPWLDVEGARFPGNPPGMSAIVRWSAERVCLEAVEIGLGTRAASTPTPDPKMGRSQSVDVMIVARFTDKVANAAFVGSSVTASVREAATCELVAP